MSLLQEASREKGFGPACLIKKFTNETIIQLLINRGQVDKEQLKRGVDIRKEVDGLTELKNKFEKQKKQKQILRIGRQEIGEDLYNQAFEFIQIKLNEKIQNLENEFNKL